MRLDMFVHEVSGDEQRLELPGYEQDGVRCPEVLLSGSEVSEYADLFSMCLDFDHVITMCEHRAAMAKDRTTSELDRMTGMRATWEAAVIAYGRAFVGGVSVGGGGRTRFPAEILNHLNAGQLAIHEQTMALRHKHVGHRVNDWTRVVVTAVLNPEGRGPRNILQVGSKVFTVVSGGESAEKLRDVAVILRKGLEDRMAVIKDEIMAQLRAVPIAELYVAAQEEAAKDAQLMELERQRQISEAATQEEVAGLSDGDPRA